MFILQIKQVLKLFLNFLILLIMLLSLLIIIMSILFILSLLLVFVNMIKSFNLDPDLLPIWDTLEHKSELFNTFLKTLFYTGLPNNCNLHCFGKFSCPQQFIFNLQDCIDCAESYFGIDKIQQDKLSH